MVSTTEGGGRNEGRKEGTKENGSRVVLVMYNDNIVLPSSRVAIAPEGFLCALFKRRTYRLRAYTNKSAVSCYRFHPQTHGDAFGGLRVIFNSRLSLHLYNYIVRSASLDYLPIYRPAHPPPPAHPFVMVVCLRCVRAQVIFA